MKPYNITREKALSEIAYAYELAGRAETYRQARWLDLHAALAHLLLKVPDDLADSVRGAMLNLERRAEWMDRMLIRGARAAVPTKETDR